jgi:hypothetical protein
MQRANLATIENADSGKIFLCERSAEQAAVFATELGGALIAYAPPGVARVEALVEHELPPWGGVVVCA